VTDPPTRVLFVDDDEEDYLIVRDLLKLLDTARFELTWAPTYERGLEAILASSYDVCLVDFRLGPRSGLEFLADVTVLAEHPQVIMLTGSGHRIVDVTASRTGAADYLVKNGLTPALLERSIRYAVERGHMLKALAADGVAPSV
jgi:two-component system cell cycle sensor histidine kinase/response regulator CckA